MDSETIMAMAALQVALNAPFYLLAIAAYLKARECECKINKKTSPKGGESNE